MDAESEDILIKGCIEWDRRAQNKLYKLYASKMFAVCFKYSSSREEAEDTFHEGFMKVFENIKNFKKEFIKCLLNVSLTKIARVRNLNMI